MTRLSLLTVSNPKTLKGGEFGVWTAILHLAPANLSGVEVCQYRTKGCTAACLNTAGRGGMFRAGATTNVIQECRKRRTRFLHESPGLFLATLRQDIAAHCDNARALGLSPAVRLNGTSDLPVESWGIIESFPDVPFYDYTKNPLRMAAFLRGEMPRNYHLTFSLAETTANRLAAFAALENGGNVAAVFATKKGDALPQEWRGFPVIDGDATDLRFWDRQGGVIVGLRAKGRAKHDTTGFVIR